MRIAIGNQKGGVGKTTLAILLSNYIKNEKKESVIVLDFDPQKSFFEKAEQEKELLEEEDVYTVINGADHLESSFRLLEMMEDDNEHVIVDLPGYMFTKDNIDILENIDLLIIPFDYSKICIESTLTYMYVISQLKPELQLCFMPNRIKANAKYDLKEKINETFGQLGFVVSEIKDSIQFTRIRCFSTSDQLNTYLLHKFAEIFSGYAETKGG